MVSLDKVKNPPMRRQLEETFTKYMGNAPIKGDVFYVQYTDGSTGASGKDINSPAKTLDQAINNSTASNGDVIFLLPGHTETYTTAGEKFDVDVAGLTIIGVGEGEERPTISYGHTGTSGTVAAASTVIANVLFVTAVDQVVTYATISGSDCTLIDCEFRDVTDKEVVTDLTITGDRFEAINCFKNGYTAGNANDAVFSMNGVSGAHIKNCRFMTKVLTSIVEFVTAASSNIIIDGCIFGVSGTTDGSKNVVDAITGSTYAIRNSFDFFAGTGYSGGSGSAPALDDVSAIATAVAAIQTDLGDASARTNLQTILAILGNPDVAGATLWSALINSNSTYSSRLGTKVTRAAADIFNGATTNLFTINGGRILLTHIAMEVTTAAVDNIASNTKLVSNPTVGTGMDLCAVLDVDSDESGSLYSITGTITDALQGGSGGGAPAMAKPIELPEGTIDLSSSADAGTGGALVKCELWYIALDSGASVAAA